MKCDVYTSDKTMAGLSDFEKLALQDYCDEFVRAVERKYELLKSSVRPEEPPQLGVLKEHLRVERIAGHKIYPARKEDRTSQSFCKAEQRKYSTA